MKKSTLENLHGQRIAATKNRLKINEAMLRQKMMEMFFGEVRLMSFKNRVVLAWEILFLRNPDNA